MSSIDLATKVKTRLDESAKIELGGTIILSVSMGVDSLTLLNILKDNYVVVAVHFNHNKREQSFEEEQAFIEICQTNNLVFHVISVPNFQTNFQARARELRIEHLVQIAREVRGVVITGHHFDDVIETAFFRYIKGSGTNNINSLRDSVEINGVHFVRPFITTRKKDIVAYARKHRIEYFEDVSNFDTVYDRGKIRNIILPEINKVNPSFEESFLNHIAFEQEMYAYFQEKAEVFISNFLIGKKDNITIKRSAFLEEYHVTQSIIIQTIFSMFNVTLKRQTNNDIVTAIKRRGNRTLKLKSETTCEIESVDVVFLKGLTEKIEAYDFSFKKIIKYPLLLPTNFLICYNNTIKQNITDSFRCDVERITYLRIRNIRTYDKVKLRYYDKLVSRILIDEKVPKRNRQKVAIVYDARTDEIIWIPGIWQKKQQSNGQCLYYIKAEES